MLASNFKEENNKKTGILYFFSYPWSLWYCSWFVWTISLGYKNLLFITTHLIIGYLGIIKGFLVLSQICPLPYNRLTESQLSKKSTMI